MLEHLETNLSNAKAKCLTIMRKKIANDLKYLTTLPLTGVLVYIYTFQMKQGSVGNNQTVPE